jgi:hypothetical protein
MEVLDGIFLNLKVKSQVEPSHVQERILRRIVEKAPGTGQVTKFMEDQKISLQPMSTLLVRASVWRI